MAKKGKAVYAPGELSRVREKLGDLDRDEAQQMVQKLGGEVGYERTEEQEKSRNTRRTRHEKVDVKIGDRPGRQRRSLELPPVEDVEYEIPEKKKKRKRQKDMDPGDDPSVLLRISYWDRIKMDKIAGQSEFEIKSPGQVLYSMLAFFSDVPDYVSSVFVLRRMTEYYKRIEVLVTSTRTMFPRNNLRWNERLKKCSPLVYSILDVIRYWDIEKISNVLARLQAHPRVVKVSDCADILRAVYKPLFILDRMDPDAHIRGAYKILYKLLYIDNPTDAENKYQELIRTALAAYTGIRRDIHFLLYPLLMKSVSSKYLPYEVFFIERRRRIMAFLQVDEENQLYPADLTILAEGKNLPGESEEEAAGEASDQPGEENQEEQQEEEISEEEKARLAAEESEKKTLDRGLQTLEALFPKAGWDRLSSYPDFYPYFVEIFDLKKGIVNIAPTDPLQQVYILMRALEELFFGLRYVSFGSVQSSSGNFERVDSVLGEIVNNWHYYLEISYEKEYLPRMAEYIRILEGAFEERSSAYTKKLISDLHWIKRLYFLPYYRFESIAPPPMQKTEVTPLYSKIKSLRKYLTAVAMGIEHGNKAGGAEARAPCDGIDNPWEAYVFQVPNPLSIRIDALLAPKARNNASLIYFCLAITAVLDNLVNNEDSWAYGPRPGPLFRSVNGEGIMPLTGVDSRIDADGLFKQTIRNRQRNNPAG